MNRRILGDLHLSDDEDLEILEPLPNAEIWFNSVNSPTTNAGNSASNTQFQLMHHISQWKDAETRKSHVSVAILFCSGVSDDNDRNKDDITVSIDGGRVLVVRILWTSCLTDGKIFMLDWLQAENGKQKLEVYHPMIQGFMTSIAKTESAHSGGTYSILRIQLPIDVQDEVSNEILERKNSPQVVLLVVCKEPERACSREPHHRLIKHHHGDNGAPLHDPSS